MNFKDINAMTFLLCIFNFINELIFVIMGLVAIRDND